MSLSKGKQLPVNRLEEWYRSHYLAARFDISSSGVEPLSMAEFCALADFDLEELQAVVFRDSDAYGGYDLRVALASRFAGQDESKVMATHGSSEALYLLLHVLAEKGDEVIVTAPAYQQLFSLVEQCGCVVKRWKLRESNGFMPDIDDLARLITNRTRLVILNFPHNPTGVSLTPEQFERLLALVAAHGSYLLWDTAFAELTYNTRPLPDACTLYERAISTGTLSKAYGLPGLRLGWCVGARDILARCVRLRDYLSLFLSPLVELLGCKAIDHAEILVARARRLGYHNLTTLETFTGELAHEVRFYKPQGGVCTLLKLKRVPDVEQFCFRLVRETSTLLVPGICFSTPKHVRLGFGGHEETFLKGLAHLREVLQSVK